MLTNDSYDFSAYGFGIYSSYILDNLLGNDNRLWVTFGWNTVINLFYMPGCIFGSWLSDWIGPRYALTLGVTLQAIVGYIMAACYQYLNKPSAVGGFVVVYGVFLALGEVGPGDNIGLIASKTSATAIRGQYYGIAGAMGKVGAFVGTYLFPVCDMLLFYRGRVLMNSIDHPKQCADRHCLRPGSILGRVFSGHLQRFVGILLPSEYRSRYHR